MTKTIIKHLLLSLAIFLKDATGQEGKAENPHSQWCPNVVCKDDSFCKPCKRRYLFIIAQGRSGSTTLKNMINFLPGVRIRGEIGNTFYNMKRVFMEDKSHNVGGSYRGSHGHHIYRETYMSCAAQSFIETIDPPFDPDSSDGNHQEDIIGFKEIRIHDMEDLRFLIARFPCSRFIFNTRSDDKELKKSQGKYFDAKRISENNMVRSLYSKARKTLSPQRVYSMDMSIWSKGNGEHFTNLSKWLGFKDCTYSGLIHDHYNGFDIQWDLLYLGDHCRLEEA